MPCITDYSAKTHTYLHGEKKRNFMHELRPKKNAEEKNFQNFRKHFKKHARYYIQMERHGHSVRLF
jgi:hypothetical protein